ncbi:hypothetical protein [Methylobacterium radiodurans]|uniref:aromatic-ring hydroxylase C-terminal domain-containing protein n=1 Tax=Methylobacterium radiodurans TaxID=2202828 RepID=UPI003CCC8535
MRQGLGFPVRLFDVLRGTEHVLVVHLNGACERAMVQELSDWMQHQAYSLQDHLRVVVVAHDAAGHTLPGAELLEDRARAFTEVYGDQAMSCLVRPDGHLGWRGRSWRDASFQEHLRRLFPAA